MKDTQSMRDEKRALVSVLASEVSPQAVKWLWPGYIPRQELTLIDGDPGVGKSTMLYDLAARFSAGGEMPDGYGVDPVGVVILSQEDDTSSIIVPRLIAAGADRRHITHITTFSDGTVPTIPNDLGYLKTLVEETGAGILIIDPLLGHLDGGVNTNSDKDVRRALAPLVLFAREHDVTVLAVRHLAKKEYESEIMKGLGSIGFAAIARAGFLVTSDGGTGGKRVLVNYKQNGARKADSLVFEITTCQLEGSIRTSSIDWHGAARFDTEDALRMRQKPRQSAVLVAVKFVVRRLASGEMGSATLEKEALATGISGSAFRIARETVSLSRKCEGGWLLRLDDSMLSGVLPSADTAGPPLESVEEDGYPIGLPPLSRTDRPGQPHQRKGATWGQGESRRE